MSRAQALEAAAAIIARQISDVENLLALLEAGGGNARLVGAIRAQLGSRPQVRGEPRPDPKLWLRGRVR